MNNPPLVTLANISSTDILSTDIVVGVNDSDSSYEAMEWGAREAALRGAALVLVNVNVWQRLNSEMWPLSAAMPEEELTEYCAVVLKEAAEDAAAIAPDVPIRTVAAIGGATAELVTHIDRGALGVVGRRAGGGFGGITIGDVASQVAQHASRPVAVIPAGWEPRGEYVVAGVDGSDLSQPVLSHAFEEASLRQLPLRIIHAWRNPKHEPPNLRVSNRHVSPAEVVSAQQRALGELSARWAEKYPQVRVERVAVRQHPVKMLLEAAESAALLVVGSRGRGGFTGLLLGSVSEALIRHTTCPTLVVR